MTDIDYTLAKNGLEILILKTEMNLRHIKPSQGDLDALNALKSALNCILSLRIRVDDLEKKSTLALLNSVKSYKETMKLKKKFHTFNKS